MKLKTLKDLDDGALMVSTGDLKAEAIKWVKDNQLRIGLISCDCCNMKHTKESIDLFIKHFFNITEEELTK